MTYRSAKGEYADKWMTGYVEHNLKWNSKRYYKDMLKRIPADVKNRPMDDISREDVRSVAFGVIGNNLSQFTANGLIRIIEVLRERRRAVAAASLASGESVSHWVFPSPTGGLTDPSKLRKEFKKVLLKAEIRADPTFHSLRRTALTGMAGNGVPIASLQRIAGHSSIEVTAKHHRNV